MATTAEDPITPKFKRKIKASKLKRKVVVIHEDLINDKWWEEGRGKDLLLD